MQEGKTQHQSRKEPGSLDQSITHLVKGLKHDLEKKYGRVNYTKLRKSGYSDYLLARLRQV